MTDAPTRFLAGSAAGFAATGPMTTVTGLLHPTQPREHRQRPLPPGEITGQATQAAGVGHRLSDGEKTGLSVVAHFGFGAAAGGGYGLVAGRRPFGPVGNGVAYGLAVWATSYLGWLPALRLYPRTDEEPAARTAMIVAAHVAWGAALGLLAEGMLPRRTPELGGGGLKARPPRRTGFHRATRRTPRSAGQPRRTGRTPDRRPPATGWR